MAIDPASKLELQESIANLSGFVDGIETGLKAQGIKIPLYVHSLMAKVSALDALVESIESEAGDE